MKPARTEPDLSAIERLERELDEARATLAAIRSGEVDALVVGKDDQEVFVLERADMPFRTLVEQMPEGVVSLDRERKILYCNRFFCDLLGTSDELLLSRPFHELLDSDSRGDFETAVCGPDRTNVSCNLICGGERVPVQLAILPSNSSRGRSTVVVSDLRIRRRLDLLLEDRDAARAEVHAKDVFLATLGHELRNPLAALSTGVAVLRAGLEDRVRSMGVIDSLERQVRQLTALVNDLLDASRIAQGKITLRHQHIRAKELVDEVTGVVRAMFEARRHELQIDVPADLSIVADPTRLEQILVNLLTNAARYSNDGGRVLLSARSETGGVVFRIRDTGLGIAPGDLERIFEPFAQVTIRGQTGGLGIGLSLVRKLAELHGGNVRAESEGVGKGSTFVVTLPSARVEETAVEAPEPAPASGPIGHRVLLIDDNVDATEMMTLLLETAGLRVQSCNVGAEALDLVRTLRPDLVLLDLGLSDMSGFDVARRIREAGHADLRIIAATGYSDARTMAEALAAGFNGRLVKPITLPQVMAELPAARA